ncbi:MAG: fused MFS/spermidine synthase [Gemmataceae bacterium]
MLVLQLVAGRLLAPFIGMSLETWTTVIGVFLAGISLGNWLGGKLADRAASEATLSRLLFGGAVATLLCLGIAMGLGDGSALRAVPLGVRIPLLTAVTCLPASLVLSMITPVTIRLMLPDVQHTGRVVGLVYALGTLGSLVGNFLTGFVLMAYLTTTVVTLGIAAVFALLGVATRFLSDGAGSVSDGPRAGATVAHASGSEMATPELTVAAACATVFCSSFCSMAAEIGASRMLAPTIGVSLYSWTAIIGVVLASMFLGNYAGGLLADRSPSREALGGRLFLAGLFIMLVPVISAVVMRLEWFEAKSLAGSSTFGMITNMVGRTAALFALPMYFLATISPQVTRLAVGDLAHAGRVAGRIYAWSCAGAIAGTFAAGYKLVSFFGVNALFFALALTLIGLALTVGRPWRRPGELFGASIVAGAALMGLFVKAKVADLKTFNVSAWTWENKLSSPYALETNYYAIAVYEKEYQGNECRAMALDHLEHSYVKGEPELETIQVKKPFSGKVEDEVIVKTWKADDAEVKAGKWKAGDEKFNVDLTFMGYEHEQVQAEFARLAASRSPKAKLLIIGGGGYTFPRWAATQVPGLSVEVCEIDPGVTEVCHRKLGLPRDIAIKSHHMDGRQFVQERAEKGTYQLVVQDAVNDLSVPYHIMTKEYNDAVAKLLDDKGVYLLTVIDHFEEGRLLRSAVKTLKESFPNVAMMASSDLWDEGSQAVFVIYASKKPFDSAEMKAALAKSNIQESVIHVMPAEKLDAYLNDKDHPAVVLTDAYAPVDNMMAAVFRLRAERR